MPSREEVVYFGAGPSGLPTHVAAAGSQAFLNYEDSGLGLAELSHRSPTANQILADTQAALISFLDIPDNYQILFLHGGGSGEFSAVVLNLVPVWVEKRRKRAEQQLSGDESAIVRRVKEDIQQYLRLDYLVTGSWSLKASQEAAQLLAPLGDKIVNVALDARTSNGGAFGTIPSEDSWRLTKSQENETCGSAFVYYCDNETVDGVEFPSFPKALEPQSGGEERLVVADMSSNILSRRIDVSKYGVIFAGAQKNLGITDITLAIVRKDLLTEVPPASFLHAVGVWSPPTIMNWSIIAKNNSLYNTMPIFSIWIAKQVLESLAATHGAAKVAGQETVANEKAALLYRVLDDHPAVYQVVPDRKARSRMNVCFRVRDSDLAAEKAFLDEAKSLGFLGIAGHRSVKGVRVSNYNSVSMANVQKLVEFLIEFAKR
ncbi:Phosphoserine transaminase [Pseudocyphellaria aurata]|nr:Phosphoserine transaminase [Pseudocyphellaria aurata]